MNKKHLLKISIQLEAADAEHAVFPLPSNQPSPPPSPPTPSPTQLLVPKERSHPAMRRLRPKALPRTPPAAHPHQRSKARRRRSDYITTNSGREKGILCLTIWGGLGWRPSRGRGGSRPGSGQRIWDGGGGLVCRKKNEVVSRDCGSFCEDLVRSTRKKI